MPKRLTTALRSAAVWLAVFACAYFAIGYLRRPMMPADAPPVLAAIDGSMQDVRVMSDDALLLLYFWGEWCGVCRLQSPAVDSVSRSGRQVLSVAVQSGSADNVRAYLAKHGCGFVAVNDPNGALFAHFQGRVAPSFVIVRKGQARQAFSGFTPAWLLKLRLALAGI